MNQLTLTTMKKADREQIIKRAKKDAYLYYIKGDYARFTDMQRNRPLCNRQDMRTIYGREFAAEVARLHNNHRLVVDSADAAYKRRMRQRERWAAEKEARVNEGLFNSLKNPLVIDYKNNKQFLTCIRPDKLSFGLRNHWAKNEKDRRIISIISRYFDK